MRARHRTSAAFSPIVHAGVRRWRSTTLLWLRSTRCFASRRSRSFGPTVAPSTSDLSLAGIFNPWTGARHTLGANLEALETGSPEFPRRPLLGSSRIEITKGPSVCCSRESFIHDVGYELPRGTLLGSPVNRGNAPLTLNATFSSNIEKASEEGYLRPSSAS